MGRREGRGDTTQLATALLAKLGAGIRRPGMANGARGALLEGEKMVGNTKVCVSSSVSEARDCP